MYSDWRIEHLDRKINRLKNYLAASIASNRSQRVIDSIRLEMVDLKEQKDFIFQQMMQSKIY